MKLGYSKILLSLVSLLLLFFSNGCTRKAESNLSLKLSVPSGSSFSSLTFPDAKLSTVIVNVRIPGKNLFVKEIDFHDSANAPQMGTPIAIEVPNAPAGSDALVQYLGVFESVSGQMLFTYGDTTVNISGAQTTANIVATQFGSSTKQGRIGGRYITGGTNSSNMSGPTGTMIAYIMPPGGKPRMAVDKSAMLNGWFNIFVLEGTTALMTFEMLDGTVIFENVNLASFNTTSSLHKKVVVNKPISYRKSYQTSSMEAEGEEDYILGFFAKDATVVSALSSTFSTLLQVCYPTASESIPGIYTSSAATAQMHYNPTDTPGTKITVNTSVSGGAVGATGNDLYVNGCNPTTMTSLRFMPHLLNGGNDSLFGMKPPFRVLNEFQSYGGGYLNAQFNGSSTINLNWAYLPGIITADVSGALVFAKYSTGGGGDSGGGGNRNCFEKASDAGMSMITTVSGTTSTTSVTSVGGTAVNSSNYYNFSFLICPYRDIVGKPREYFAEAQSGCIGDCGSSEHFGWGTTSNTVSSSSSYPSDAIARVTSIDPYTTAGHEYISLGLGGSATGIQDGDEVLIRIAAMDTGSPCGTTAYLNQYTFARVLSTSAGVVVNIPRGTFVDNLSTAGLSAAVGSGGYCFVQVAKVLHYQDMTINGGAQFYTNAQGPLGNTNSGGVIPLRISGTLTLNNGSIITAAGSGFSGGTSSMSGASPYAGGGGTGVASLGAGGGAGAVGSGGNGNGSGGTGGSGYGGGGGMLKLAMGSGGGSTPGTVGGAGGGMIYIAARQINNLATGTTPVIAANGSIGSISTSMVGGAGGAGSIAIIAEKILTANAIDLQVAGGNGMSDTGAYSGGGGGGAATVVACDGNNTSAIFNVNTSGGLSGGGAATAGSAGYTSAMSIFPDSTMYGVCH